MAGTEESGSQGVQWNECSFEWDEDSQLYFHASTGFYHDPNAGWYYSSRDGLYYKFENGSYVLLESDEGRESETHSASGTTFNESIQDEQCYTECINMPEMDNPPPPSEWLEETLIDLYLKGYSTPAINVANDLMITSEADGEEDLKLSDQGNYDSQELEEGELIAEDFQDSNMSSGVQNEGTSWDEESWRAQYGQVVQSGEKDYLDYPTVDIWDWVVVTHTTKKNNQVSRLVGRLVKKTTKLHPSVPSGSGLWRTAVICEAHLDLVRVASGQVYRLRTPSAQHLTSSSTYDSSDPTKDWGFPKLFIDEQSIHLPRVCGGSESEALDGVPIFESPYELSDQLPILEKDRCHKYRDRAAERRALHGGFGVGPGQKNLEVYDSETTPSPLSVCTEDAATEAMNLSFGSGSYARRILESMGWKEGEGLGSTRKGLIEPLQAVGNKGYAGLGWDQARSDHH